MFMIVVFVLSQVLFRLDDKVYSIYVVVMEVTIGLVLVLAVFMMRQVVKRTAFAYPNEKLVMLHSINFIVWLILYTLEKICVIKSGALEAERELMVDGSDAD